MKTLTKQELIELQDYIDALYEQVSFDANTYNEITKAVDKRLDKIKSEENTINHFDSY